MVTFGKRVRRFALTLLPALAALAALAVMAPARADAAGCPGQSLAQTFQRWADPAWYTPLPDAGFEAGSETWNLRTAANVVAGNEPYYVGARDDRRSLSLALDGSATSAALCVGLGHPTIRFFARNTGSAAATLAVSVQFRDLRGNQRSTPIGLITAGPRWEPTPPLPVTVNALALLTAQDVHFGFSPASGRGEWSVDDVYVDPYGKG
jgi:hypothetical protein